MAPIMTVSTIPHLGNNQLPSILVSIRGWGLKWYAHKTDLTTSKFQPKKPLAIQYQLGIYFMKLVNIQIAVSDTYMFKIDKLRDIVYGILLYQIFREMFILEERYGNVSGCIYMDKRNKIHYIDVIMGTIASQITSLTIVYSTVYSDADQRKYQSTASLAFVRGIHRRPVNSPDKWPVTRKMFTFDDVIISVENSCTLRQI